MEPHRAPPPSFIAEQAHRGGASTYWLVPRPIALRVDRSATASDVKLFVTNGRGVLEQCGRRAELGPGSFVWLDPSVPHRLELEGGSSMIVRYSRAELRRLQPLLDVSAAVRRGDELAERLAARHFADVLAAGSQLTASQRTAATESVTAALALCPQKPASPAERHVALAQADINAMLREPGLTPEEVANRRGVSRRRLDRAFLAVLGTTVADAIRTRRLDAVAAELVARHQHASVAEVASAWGFPDASHFGRMFRRQFGCTPGEFRRRRR